MTRRTMITVALFAAICPACASADGVQAVPVERFLDSIGVVSSFAGRGQPLAQTIRMVRYAGFRWVRAGIEQLDDTGPVTLESYLALHRATGATLSWGLMSGSSDVDRLVATGRTLAQAGALLAFEGNNEPNNWAVTVGGAKGGKDGSWAPVATIQRTLYARVKADPALKRYPIWSISEAGAETENVGLQYLTIPAGAGTTMPAGTRYADAANLHNYPVRASRVPLPDNLAWNAADPSPAARADGVYGNYGETWRKHFRGYDQATLDRLPRVTTETGTTLQGDVDEHRQGVILLDTYLAQFARGFSHTAVYLLRDRTDEPGNQTFGFFRPDYTPRRSATYLHAMTQILGAATGSPGPPRLAYAVKRRSETVHDLLFRARDGTLMLVLWGERVIGEDRIAVTFAGPHDAAIYDPTLGTTAVRTVAGTDRIDLTIGDHPVIVVLGGRRR